jgi:phospholipid-binding lipoprotein MlaA
MNSRHCFLALAAIGALSGCAALPTGERDGRDRYERGNRAVYRFNSALDRGIAKPIAKTYVKVTPKPVRTGLGNFFRNLTYPTVIANDLLQAKGKAFVVDTTRLVVNTTIGIGGLFDPATQMGLAAGDEDFGQTLGKWGVPAGPYLMLPILGPSSIRDAFGFGVDQFTDPKSYLSNIYLSLGLTALDLVDNRAELLSTENVLNNSYDPYAFVRNAYLQRREFQVKDGSASADDEVEIFEDSDAPTEPAATAAPATIAQ